MKRFISVATAACCFLYAFIVLMPISAHADDGPGDFQDSLKNKHSSVGRANTLAVFRGIETGDLSAMDKFVSKDIVDHAGMQDVKGLENLKKILSDIHNHFNNLKFTLITSAASDDGLYHFSLSRMTGTTKDASMGIPPNTPIDRMSVVVVRMENNMVVEHWSFDDPREMMKMMQMMKK